VQLRDQQPLFDAAGARLAAIGLGDVTHARAFHAETGMTFPLFVDAERRAYTAAGLGRAGLLHLLHPFNFRARAAAKAQGFRQVGLGRDPLQLGGTFVLGPGDTERFAHVSATFGDNADVGAVLAAVRA
jgi:hypothetical protein